jgi:F-type H+-transporting ATPase subunit b
VIQVLHILAAEESGGISALGIDPLAILAQGVTFLLLFWVIKRFALGKIVDTLEKRRKTINDGITLGEEMRLEKDKLAEIIEQAMTDARAEAGKIIASAQEETNQMLKEAEEKAATKTANMLKDAQAHITDEIEKARKDLEKEMVSLVADATEIMLREKLTGEKDNALIKRSLQEVGRE